MNKQQINNNFHLKLWASQHNKFKPKALVFLH